MPFRNVKLWQLFGQGYGTSCRMERGQVDMIKGEDDQKILRRDEKIHDCLKKIKK